MAIQREYNTTYEYLESVFSRLDYAPQTAYQSFKSMIPLHIPINKGVVFKILKFIKDNSLKPSDTTGSEIIFRTNSCTINDNGNEFVCKNYNNSISMEIYIKCDDATFSLIEEKECYLIMFIESLASILSYNYNCKLIRRRYYGE